MSKKKSNTHKVDSNQEDDISKNKILKETIEENEEISENIINELQKQLNEEKQKLLQCENKLKLSLADFQNLERKFSSDLERNLNTKIDGFIIDFLQIYDDFMLAKKAYADNTIDTSGLDSILKNMNSLLSKYNVTAIEALGEIFNPNLHEAISVIEDSELDDGTITKVIRKGYISHQRVIRPALVEITKKSKSD